MNRTANKTGKLHQREFIMVGFDGAEKRAVIVLTNSGYLAGGVTPRGIAIARENDENILKIMQQRIQMLIIRHSVAKGKIGQRKI